MFRTFSLAAVAALAMGAAALAPTPAAAWGGGWHGGGWHGGGWHGGWHGGYHRGWGPRFYGGGYGVPVAYGYGGCYVRQLVPTPWGPRFRLVNRCY